MEILKNIHWVGAVDWNRRVFHGHTYTTTRGTTYNAYLILDEKVTLIDTVMGDFSADMIERIREIIPVEKIDYIVVNHVEIDHSGALPEVLRLNPKAKVFCTAKAKEGLLKHYYGDWNFNIVKTNDKLELGKRVLSFIEAPMIHWPDSMFTYCIEDELLMPNDAFGQHYAASVRFDDSVDQCALMDEAAKYYANILMPLSPLILRKLQEIKKMNIPIKMIAPSHGVIWRKDPGKIINAYQYWAGNSTIKKAVIVYETMWGSTAKMAEKIARGIADEDVEVKLFDINLSDRTEIIKDMLDARGYIIGSSTHDNGMLSGIAGFLEFLKGLKPKNRAAGVFGSYGWAGGAAQEMKKALESAEIKVIQEPLAVRYVPDKDELKKCYEYGRSFAKQLKDIP